MGERKSVVTLNIRSYTFSRKRWYQMTGSGHATPFILLFFSLILMTCELVFREAEWCCGVQHQHLRVLGIGRGHKMDRWRALSLPWGQVSRECGGGQRQNHTETGEKMRQWEGEESKRERKKARTVSENVAKEQDMDQSQGKSKAQSLWKDGRETAIVSLNIRPYLLHE